MGDLDGVDDEVDVHVVGGAVCRLLGHFLAGAEGAVRVLGDGRRKERSLGALAAVQRDLGEVLGRLDVDLILGWKQNSGFLAVSTAFSRLVSSVGLPPQERASPLMSTTAVGRASRALLKSETMPPKE